MSDFTTEIRALEARAAALQSIIDLAPRAFVVEFAGTPKSGKSTSVEAIRHFFRRHDFRVHVLTERASLCPIPMKGHLFFNTWCATTMLAELLENVDTSTDIIIADRGLFDALIWFQMQGRRGELTTEELETIERFLLMDRWRSLVDLVAVLEASASVALQRESSQRITARSGSVMNSAVLDALAAAVTDAAGRYGSNFRRLFRHNTDIGDVKSTNAKIAAHILDAFEAFVNPPVLVVPRSAIEQLLARVPDAFENEDAGKMLSAIEEQGTFRRRAEVEADDTFVQVVSCGALLYHGRVFVFLRHDKNPKSRLYGKATVWQGCHIEEPATPISVDKLLMQALEARIARSLFISRKIRSRFVGYAYDATSPEGRRHLGLFHCIDVESDDLAESLKKKEFRRTRGHTIAGDFRAIAEVKQGMAEIDLEPWSRAVVQYLERKLK